MRYRAAAALPWNDRDRAISGLRDQLRLMAAAVGDIADWTTLTVEGPSQEVGRHGAVWFEWTATVEAEGGQRLPADDALDAAVPPAPRIGGAPEPTAPVLAVPSRAGARLREG